MDAKLVFACLALGSLMGCAASAPNPQSEQAIDFAKHDPYFGKSFWTVIPFEVSAVPDISKESLELPAGTHFEVAAVEQGVLHAGGITSLEPGYFYYRMVLDDGRSVYLLSTLMKGYVSDGPPEDLSKASDREIVKRIIQESRQSYDGQCACPDDRSYNGLACGGRSAYSHKRGIMCYPADVTRDQIAEYRSKLHFHSVQ
jgi:hypothetical protein